MSDSAALFDLDPAEVKPDPTDGLSADAKRTARRKALLERGIHPATGLPLAAKSAGTCGSCVHRFVKHAGNFVGSKCELAARGGKDGPDIRKSWPACTAYVEEASDEG